MKSLLRNAARLVFGCVCLLLSGLPTQATNIQLYSNGPALPSDTYAWDISTPGKVVSNSFVISAPAVITSFSFGVWVTSATVPLTVDWSMTSQEFGGTTYASGTNAPLTNLVKQAWTQNNPSLCYNPCDVYQVTVSSLNVNLAPGSYWLNLQNATATGFGAFVGWDENSGPSMASDSSVGTIASEDPDIYGYYSSGGGETPEPGTLTLFGTGILSLAGLLRRRSLGA